VRVVAQERRDRGGRLAPEHEAARLLDRGVARDEAVEPPPVLRVIEQLEIRQLLTDPQQANRIRGGARMIVEPGSDRATGSSDQIAARPPSTARTAPLT
jgi:hypothetical protein